MDTITYLLSKTYTNNAISETGLKGKSAYEIAVDNGFEGSEEEWLESLKGGGSVDMEPLTVEEILEICKGD